MAMSGGKETSRKALLKHRNGLPVVGRGASGICTAAGILAGMLIAAPVPVRAVARLHPTHGRYIMALRRFALVFGIVFLVIGAGGFVPGMVAPHTHPDMRVTSGLGLELSLFAVNVLHNVAHLLFGVWGLMASRSTAGARSYGKGVAIIYALLAVMGLVPGMNLHTAFGLVPLYGHDVWLHALLAAIGGYFGFLHRDEEAHT
jgi:hypothetical protein